jgi:hypothetical protein
MLRVGVNDLLEALADELAQLDREGDVLLFKSKPQMDKQLVTAMEHAIIDIDDDIVDIDPKDYKEE